MRAVAEPAGGARWTRAETARKFAGIGSERVMRVRAVQARLIDDADTRRRCDELIPSHAGKAPFAELLVTQPNSLSDEHPQ